MKYCLPNWVLTPNYGAKFYLAVSLLIIGVFGYLKVLFNSKSSTLIKLSKSTRNRCRIPSFP